jgi:hypothetical protein
MQRSSPCTNQITRSQRYIATCKEQNSVSKQDQRTENPQSSAYIGINFSENRKLLEAQHK